MYATPRWFARLTSLSDAQGKAVSTTDCSNPVFLLWKQIQHHHHDVCRALRPACYISNLPGSFSSYNSLCYCLRISIGTIIIHDQIPYLHFPVWWTLPDVNHNILVSPYPWSLHYVSNYIPLLATKHWSSLCVLWDHCTTPDGKPVGPVHPRSMTLEPLFVLRVNGVDLLFPCWA